MNFAEIIRNRRTTLNYTQESLANALHVDPKTVSAWECGRIQIPDYSLWEPLCNVLGVSVMDLLFGNDSCILIPHAVPEVEYARKVWEDFGGLGGNDLVHDIVRRHRLSIEDTAWTSECRGRECCWDYKLTLSPREFEICTYFAEVRHDCNDIFSAYEKYVLPRNLTVVFAKQY